MLLDTYDGITNGLHQISIINGEQVFWQYREERDSNGYSCVVDRRSDASEISLEGDRHATVLLDAGCENHPMLAKVEADIAKAKGDEI